MSMRVLVYTHRFGRHFVAGAEQHLWNLAEQMALMGCQVDVATTLQDDLRPFLRFGQFWRVGQAERPFEEIEVPGAGHPIRIHRFPVRNLSKPLAALLQKYLQRQWEKEEMGMEPAQPLPMRFPLAHPVLLTGWHLPELSDGKLVRWTMPRTAVQLPPLRDASLHLSAYAPRRQTLTVDHAGRRRIVFKGKGSFQVSVRLDECSMPSIAVLETEPVYRPLRDARTLGVLVTQMSLSNRDRIELAPMSADHRMIRAQDRKKFIETYCARAEQRPARYSWIFDALRGPSCRGMEKFLLKHAGGYDWVLAGILPFSVLPRLTSLRRKANFRLAALPLLHVDDDFYYWRHYLKALRETDVCLANSWYSFENFFPAIGAKAIMAGAGVNDTLFRGENISGARFRKRYGIAPDEKIVLSVGRKSGTKRYRTLVEAVENIQERMPCKLILVGPDEDRLPIISPNCNYLGVLSQDDLLDAYDACEVFALMSESESFGMVFVEAWMREKPVIGNGNCAPVSYLIKPEENGLLAMDREELEGHLVTLLSDPERCEAYGKAGRAQVMENHTWPVIARKILGHFQKAMQPGAGSENAGGT
jgi:glycosyltransferase involved in cell wall biosynthesis